MNHKIYKNNIILLGDVKLLVFKIKKIVYASLFYNYFIIIIYIKITIITDHCDYEEPVTKFQITDDFEGCKRAFVNKEFDSFRQILSGKFKL